MFSIFMHNAFIICLILSCFLYVIIISIIEKSFMYKIQNSKCEMWFSKVISFMFKTMSQFFSKIVKNKTSPPKSLVKERGKWWNKWWFYWIISHFCFSSSLPNCYLYVSENALMTFNTLHTNLKNIELCQLCKVNKSSVCIYIMI